MKQVHRWQQISPIILGLLIVQIGLLYLFASLAIARGNLWYYLLSLILLIAAGQNIWRLLRNGLSHLIRKVRAHA